MLKTNLWALLLSSALACMACKKTEKARVGTTSGSASAAGSSAAPPAGIDCLQVCDQLRIRVEKCMNDTGYEAPAIVRPDLRKLIEVAVMQLDCPADCPLWSSAETARVAKCLENPTCNRFESCLNNSAKPGTRDNPKTKVREQDGATMLFVPAGKFYRGAPDKVGGDDEHPGVQVQLSAYWIDRTEVTAAQYQKCADAGGCSRPGTSPLCNFGKAGRARHPINCVSWHHADTYCKWAGAALPSEAQWEKAARGPGGRLFSWIGFTPSCNKIVWFDPKFGKSCGQKSTWAVGSKPGGTSPYGAVDVGKEMAGAKGERPRRPRMGSGVEISVAVFTPLSCFSAVSA